MARFSWGGGGYEVGEGGGKWGRGYRRGAGVYVTGRCHQIIGQWHQQCCQSQFPPPHHHPQAGQRAPHLKITPPHHHSQELQYLQAHPHTNPNQFPLHINVRRRKYKYSQRHLLPPLAPSIKVSGGGGLQPHTTHHIHKDCYKQSTAQAEALPALYGFLVLTLCAMLLVHMCTFGGARCGWVGGWACGKAPSCLVVMSDCLGSLMSFRMSWLGVAKSN